MKNDQADRRKFIKDSVTTAASMVVLSALTGKGTDAREHSSSGSEVRGVSRNPRTPQAPRIRFSAIGINHDHIHSQIGAAVRGGGQFVAFYAKEPDLAAAFAKRYRLEKLIRTIQEWTLKSLEPGTLLSCRFV